MRLEDKLYHLDDNLQVDGLAKASVQDVEGPYRSGDRLLRLQILYVMSLSTIIHRCALVRGEIQMRPDFWLRKAKAKMLDRLPPVLSN